MTTKVIERTQPQPPPLNISDEYLIQQFIQGNELAFNTLYHRYVKVVYNRVRYVTPETDVEDVTQEVFIAVLHSLPSFRGEAKFSTWLRTLTDNKVAENYRKRYRKKETMQVDLEYAEQSSDHSNVSFLEDLITIQHALNSLPKQYREVILLRFAEGMPFNEIADCLNKNLEATKSLHRRAIAALKETLDVKNE
jgi:RNA polymerase sigma-70 factor (ECF subfamily)